MPSILRFLGESWYNEVVIWVKTSKVVVLKSLSGLIVTNG